MSTLRTDCRSWLAPYANAWIACLSLTARPMWINGFLQSSASLQNLELEHGSVWTTREQTPGMSGRVRQCERASPARAAMSSDLYDDAFYRSQSSGSFRSAE